MDSSIASAPAVSETQRNQYDAAAALACARRLNEATRRDGPFGASMTSSTKPETDNVSQRRRRRTEPKRYAIITKNMVKIGHAVPEIWRTDTRTDRHTHRNTPLPYEGRSDSTSSYSRQVARGRIAPAPWRTRLRILTARMSGHTQL